MFLSSCQGVQVFFLLVETRPLKSQNHYSVMTLETPLRDQRAAEKSAVLIKALQRTTFEQHACV